VFNERETLPELYRRLASSCAVGSMESAVLTPAADGEAAEAGPSGRRPSTLALLAYGLVWALIGAGLLYLLSPHPWPIDSGRASSMVDSLSVLNHGGPLLAMRLPSGAWGAVGVGDDLGIYVIIPTLDHWLGISDPVATLRDLWLLLWAVTITVYPLLFQRRFESVLAAAVSAPALIVCIFSFGFADLYWVAAWIVLTFLPVLLLMSRRWPRWGGFALVAISLVAGVVNVVRSEAGLPVAIVCLAVALFAPIRWRWRILTGLAVIVVYWAPGGPGLSAIQSHRDSVLHVNLTASNPSSHSLWHPAYLGLGYTSNRYHIHWNDTDGLVAAERADPGVKYLSAAYENTLRHLFFKVVEKDPGLLFRELGEKVVVIAGDSVTYLLLLVLLLPGALTARRTARLGRREFLMALPVLVIGIIPPLLGIPEREYELSLLGALGFLGMMCVGSTASRVELAGFARARGVIRASVGAVKRAARLWPWRTWVRVAVPGVIVVLALWAAARPIRNDHTRWDASEKQPSVTLPAGVTSPTASRLTEWPIEL
jgi:hypothetical protein